MGEETFQNRLINTLCEIRLSDFGCRVSGFGGRVSGFEVGVVGFRVSGFGLRVEGLGCRVSDLEIGVYLGLGGLGLRF